MNKVWIVWTDSPNWDEYHPELVGVYSSKEKAEANRAHRNWITEEIVK